MTVEELLNEDVKELYPSLYYLIMSDPENGIHIIDEFKSARRYQSDELFKLTVDSASLIAYGVIGRHDTIVSLAPEIIDRAIKLKHWKLVATNWNNLGTTYATLLILEKALECYCHVINTEKQHGAHELTSMAYYNLSSIFYDVGAHHKSLNYIEKAVESLNPEELKRAIMAPRYLLYLSLHLQLLCRTGNLDKAEEVYQILKEPYDTEAFRESRFSFRVAEMYYIFYTAPEPDVLECYENIMALVDKRDYTRKYLTIDAYVELCERFCIDYKYYEKQLLEVDGMPELSSYYVMSRLYGWLRKYYLAKNRVEDAARVTLKYIEYLEKNRDFDLDQKRHSLETVESLLIVKTSEEVRNKNVELKFLADEAIKNKNALEAAYKNLEKMSSMDGLTHISSRRDFENRFLTMIEQAKVEGENVLVFMMDIDYFKVYNDTYGHLEGDEVLKRVALIFKEGLERVNGLAARFGGEEFIGACVGLSVEEGEGLAQSICDDIRNLAMENRNTKLKVVTVSIGVSLGVDVHKEDRSKMMKLADIALYEAKGRGRNTVILKDLSI